MATERNQPDASMADEIRRLERFFRIFAATQCHGRSLVDERLSEAIAGDDDTLRLFLQTPAEQQRPSLLLAVGDPYLRWLAPAHSSTDDFAWVR